MHFCISDWKCTSVFSAGSALLSSQLEVHFWDFCLSNWKCTSVILTVGKLPYSLLEVQFCLSSSKCTSVFPTRSELLSCQLEVQFCYPNQSKLLSRLPDTGSAQVLSSLLLYFNWTYNLIRKVTKKHFFQKISRDMLCKKIFFKAHAITRLVHL